MPELDYLNADLDLLFKAEPAVLLRDLGRKVIVVQSWPAAEGHYVCLELNRQMKPHVSLKSLQGWIEVLEGLSPAARREFDEAQTRTMNLGFDVRHRETRTYAQLHLPAEFLAALARLKTSHVVTLYDDELEAASKPAGPKKKAPIRQR